MKQNCPYGFWPKTIDVRDNLNGTWTLLAPMFYTHKTSGRSWMVPTGFVTDFGSVPAVVDWVIPKNATIADPAYVMHDFHYHTNRVGLPQVSSRRDADNLLYDALLDCGVNKTKAYVIYVAVRAFGGIAWNRKETLPPQQLPMTATT